MSTNREVLWEVVRPVLAWPMRSPVRLGLVAAALVLVLVLVAQISGGTSPQEAAPVPDDAAVTTTDQAAVTAGDRPTPLPAAPAPAGPGRVPGEQEAATSEQADDHGHDHSHEGGLGLDEGWVPQEEAGDAALVTAETVADEQIVQLGVDTVAAMARPDDDVDEATWWEKFSVHLTEQARNDYEGVDPRNVPWSSAGEGALLPDTGHAHLVRMVQVQTERGPVVAHVARDGDGWAVSRVSWDWS